MNAAGAARTLGVAGAGTMGAGIAQLQSATVDFAGSDPAEKPAEKSAKTADT